MPQPRHWQKSTFSDGGEGNTCVEIAATSPTTSPPPRKQQPHHRTHHQRNPVGAPHTRRQVSPLPHLSTPTPGGYPPPRS
ncbi:DUF397 domain-containing protein [Streptomyces sp. NPDC050548]|uniref:DUF397 domain-containing protein n=1 Tax=Streptomyces sp. NPDC050548 TaxID=3365629 RepID=UPI00378FA19A